MAKSRRHYTWDHEPPPKRSGASEFQTTRGSEWHTTTHSTFAEPSRLDTGKHKKVSRSEKPGSQRRTGMIMLASGVSLLLCVALVAAARLMA